LTGLMSIQAFNAKELVGNCFEGQRRGKERGLHRLFMHTSVKNLAMINFASKNGFKFIKYIEEFWGEGTGDAFLLVKEL